jgi:hypothetical protein
MFSSCSLLNTNFISSSHNAFTYDFEMCDWDYKIAIFFPNICVVVNCLDSLNLATHKKNIVWATFLRLSTKSHSHVQNNDLQSGLNINEKKFLEINGLLLPNYLIIPMVEKNSMKMLFKWKFMWTFNCLFLLIWSTQLCTCLTITMV